MRRGGKAEDVGGRIWLWGDIDYGTVGHAKPAPYATRDEALAAIDAVGIPPTLLVDTGGGFHPWYALQEEPSPEEWREAISGLALALRADENALDPPRILRVAGTLNFKVDPPVRPVGLLRATDAVYPIGTFLGASARAADPPTGHSPDAGSEGSRRRGPPLRPRQRRPHGRRHYCVARRCRRRTRGRAPLLRLSGAQRQEDPSQMVAGGVFRPTPRLLLR